MGDLALQGIVAGTFKGYAKADMLFFVEVILEQNMQYY
jgi:hypothetical protein